MKESDTPQPMSLRHLSIATAVSVTLLWAAQPPWMLWPFALIALAPLVSLVTSASPISKRGYLVIWGVATLYWLLSLQGLRYAHWAMHFCWIALAGYLAVYHVLFLIAARWMVARKAPLFFAIAVAWTGFECIRSYMLTGISACMLGQTLADVPLMVQIADLFGTYGVSFVIAAINVGAFRVAHTIWTRSLSKGCLADVVAAVVLIGLTLLYGQSAMRRPLGKTAGTFALVQRSETVEYQQEMGREADMFRAYATDTVRAIRDADKKVDAIVWPESMFTGGNPWMIADPDAAAPPSADPMVPPMSPEDLQRGVAQNREFFLQRASYLFDAIRVERPGDSPPHLIVGSGVVHYGKTPEVYCGVISISAQRGVEDWYGKTHLVMFGEYIPVLPHIPGLSSLVPPELGLKTGPGPKRFEINGTSISPNICIETAVERVTVNQLRQLRISGGLPDLIVTVTNDGWFDDSSVIDHHRRCAQLVAVACRRPILSAANNGPTVWIDSRGQVVERIETGAEGVLLASPQLDSRTSLYILIGDWPARICALVSLLTLAAAWRDHKNR